MRGPYGKLWTEFFPSFYGHENKEGKKRGSITCPTDWANEANKMFIIWLCWLFRFWNGNRELEVRTATYGPGIDQSQHAKSVSHIIKVYINRASFLRSASVIALPCAPQNCSRSTFCCTPQQFAWLHDHWNFWKRNTFQRKLASLLRKYFSHYIIGHERSLYGGISLTNKSWAKAWHSSIKTNL